MSDNRHERNIDLVKRQFSEGKLDRREFIRYGTLLGMSAATAYAFAGQPLIRRAKAEKPQGGTLRIGMRVQELREPHALDWVMPSNIVRQVVEYATKTGHDNVTEPYLVEGWEVSEDLRTWTFTVREGVRWHNGRPLLAEDITWNLEHALDPATGSSVVGLMEGYMLDRVERNGEEVHELWDANAIEVIDDRTFRLNLKTPQVAIPEHLFHYPMFILDPEEGGRFGANSNGTGPFRLVEHQIGDRAVLEPVSDYWGEGPYLDQLIFVDLGDDPSAMLAAMASRQVDGVYEGNVDQIQTYENMDHVQIYEATTAQTAVARGQVDQEPFTDARVRKAFRLATDSDRLLELAHAGLGAPTNHDHVAPVHPDQADLGRMERDVEEAKRLLEEAGYPDGVDVELNCKRDPAWELNAAQAMAEQWAEAGIRCRLNVLPSAQYWDHWTTFPFSLTEWTHRPLGFMVLGLAYRSGVPWNESNYANPEFDELLGQAESILDVDERKEVMAKLQEIMREDGPIVQPLWRSVYTVYDRRVSGFEMHPTSYLFANELAIEEA